MAFELPVLPYAKNALEPFISEQTLDFHYGKHHQTYLTNLNNLIRNTALADKTLEHIIRDTAGKPEKSAVFNNAAQSFNHAFYWKSLRPNGDGRIPESTFKAAVLKTFGGAESLKAELKSAALSQFGSGWAWLVKENGALKVAKTANADTPVTRGQTPILTIDVWEHAYYLDYQNRRADYVQSIIDNLLNWDFAAANFALSDK